MNPEVWRACTGTAAARIPKLHARVYYFLQGHAGHSCPTSQEASHLLRHQSPLLYRVSAVDLLADPKTDELFAKLILIPVTENDPPVDTSNGDNQIVSFSKILTSSDANNGGGFSVPRGCALSIFPQLNLQEDKPSQVLDITDLHGKEWRFSHVYRGSPKRHLFTTGWSKFVDGKKLVAGDTIIFMKNSSDALFVGIRRSRKLDSTAQKKKMEVTEKSLAEAVDKAGKNMEFEVVYYPKAGEWDFVVDAKIVDEAMKIDWVCGMRVKIAVMTEDSSKTVSYQGTVTSIYGGHWRKLQVEWDEPKALKNAQLVSPWEVELVSPTLTLPFLPTKKLKADHHREEGDPQNQTMLSCDTSPFGIQGARHDSFTSLLIDDPSLDIGISSSSNTSMQRLTPVSTMLTLASSESCVLSADYSDSSLNSFGNTTEVGCGPIRLFGKTIYPSDCNSSGNTKEVGCGPIRLFGKIIYPGKIDPRDSGCEEGNSDQCKGKNKIA